MGRSSQGQGGFNLKHPRVAANEFGILILSYCADGDLHFLEELYSAV